MFYKKNFDEPWQTFDFLVDNFNAEIIPPSNTIPRGISKKKKEDICTKLGPLMTPQARQWWQDLPESSTNSDLLQELEEGEAEGRRN